MEETRNATLEEFMRKELDEYEFEAEGPLGDHADFEKLYSEQELTKKLAELKRLRD